MTIDVVVVFVVLGVSLPSFYIQGGRSYVTPHVTFFTNYLHWRLNHASSVLVNRILIETKGIRFDFNLNLQSKSTNS
jgi:hypothetical protein